MMKSMTKRMISLICAVSMTLSILSSAAFAATPADLKAKLDSYGTVDFKKNDFDGWKSRVDEVLGMYGALSDEDKAGVDEPDKDIISGYEEFKTNEADYERAYNIYADINNVLNAYEGLTPDEKEEPANKQKLIEGLERINGEIENEDGSNLKVLEILGRYNYGRFESSYVKYSDKFIDEALNILTGGMVKLAAILGDGADFETNGVNIKDETYIEVRKYIKNIAANYDKLCDAQKDYLREGFEKNLYDTEDYFDGDTDYAHLAIAPESYINFVKDAESVFISDKEKYFNEKIDELKAFKDSKIKYEEANALSAEYNTLKGKVNTVESPLFDSTNAISDAIKDLCGFNWAMKKFADKVDEIGTIDFATANYSSDMKKIEDAEALYNALTDEQKENTAVKGYKATLDERKDDLIKFGEKAVKDVEDLINAIGTIEYNLTALGRVEAARAAYDKLDATLQGRVSNYDVLTKAEDDIKDYRAANAVDILIDTIGNVENLDTDDIVLTDSCKNKIEKARDEYEKLTDVQKALMQKYAKLELAETEYAQLVSDRDEINGYIDSFKADEAAFAYTSTTDMTVFDTVLANYNAAESKLENLSYKSKLESLMTGASELAGKINLFKDELTKFNGKNTDLNSGYDEWYEKYKEYTDDETVVKRSDYATDKEYLEALAPVAGSDITKYFLGIFNAMSDIAASYKSELDVYENMGYTVNYEEEPYKTAKANYEEFNRVLDEFKALSGEFTQAFESVDAWADKVNELSNKVNSADGTLKTDEISLADFVIGVNELDEIYNAFNTYEEAYAKYQKDYEFNRYKYLVALSSYYIAGYKYVYGDNTFTGAEDYYTMEYSEAEAKKDALAELYAQLSSIVKSIPEVIEANRKYNAMTWGIEAYNALKGENITLAAIYNLEEVYIDSGYYKEYNRASDMYDKLQEKETEIVVSMINELNYNNYETNIKGINEAYGKLDDNQKASVTNYKKVEYAEKAMKAANNVLVGSAADIAAIDEKADAIEEIYNAYYGDDKEYAALAFEILENKKVLDDLRNAVIELIDTTIENKLPAYDDIAALDIKADDFADKAAEYQAIIDDIAKVYSYFDVRRDNAAKAEIKKMYNKTSIDAKLAVTKYSKYELCKNKLAEKIAEYNSYKADEVNFAINAIVGENITAANYENIIAAIADCRDKYEKLTDEQKALVYNYEALANAEAECAAYTEARKEADEIIAKAKDVMNEYANLTDENYKDAQKAAEEVIELIAGASAKAKEFGLADYDNDMQKLIEATRNIEEYMSVVELIDELKNELYDEIVNNGAINSAYGVRIAEAERAYGELSLENKLKISNYSTLKVMREAYDRNVATAIEETKAAIDAIPAIDDIRKPEDGDKIATAREKFESLSEENQAKLGAEYKEKLEAAIAKYNSLYSINDVVTMIDNLENPATLVITESNIDAIKKDVDAARKAYDSLRIDQKSEVTNYAKLTLLEQMIGEYAKKPGDANNDGKVDIFDVLDMVDAALERKTLDAEAFERCNLVKGDGTEPEVIDIFDILEVLKLVEFE